MESTGANDHHNKTNMAGSFEQTHKAANSFYDVENLSTHRTRGKLKWDWLPVTNSGGFTTGMTRELIAVQLPDLCTTGCRHILFFLSC